MKKIATLIVAIVALIMAFVLLIIYATTKSDISIYVNDSEVIFTVPPVVENGVVYVQERPIFEKLGFTDVKHMPDIDAFFALRGEQAYKFDETDNNKLVLCSNGNLSFDMQAAQPCGSFFSVRVLESIYDIAKRYNCDVHWNERSKTVYFNEKSNKTEKLTIIYSLNGTRKIVLIKDLDTWLDKGWYTEPVTKLYADGGKSIIVKLKEVSEYTKKGWKPIQKYILEAPFNEIQKQFGTLNFEEYYAGTPNSGDVPRNYYSNSKDSDIHIEISFWEKSATCMTLLLKLKDIFPYLNLYADSDGDISVDSINEALEDNEIYGLNYRVFNKQIYDIYNSFTKLHSYESGDGYVYYFEYDGIPVCIYTDTFNYININTALCNIDMLV